MAAISSTLRLVISLQIVLTAMELFGESRLIPRIKSVKTKRSSWPSFSFLYCRNLLRHKNVNPASFLETCGRFSALKRSVPEWSRDGRLPEGEGFRGGSKLTLKHRLEMIDELIEAILSIEATVLNEDLPHEDASISGRKLVEANPLSVLRRLKKLARRRL